MATEKLLQKTRNILQKRRVCMGWNVHGVELDRALCNERAILLW